MPLGAVNQAMQKEHCGKDGQHHNVCECPSQTRSTQHASFSNQRVMYSTDGYIVQSDRSLHTKAMCRCGFRNQQMGRKGQLFLYNIGSDAKLFLFLFLFLQMVITEYKCTSYKRVVNGYYIPFYIIQIYCGAPVDANDNSNKNTKWGHVTTQTFFQFFQNFSVEKSQVKKLTSV